MDFVQQGALIAMALVLVAQPEARAKPLRDHINRLYGSKTSEVCVETYSIFLCPCMLRCYGMLLAGSCTTQCSAVSAAPVQPAVVRCPPHRPFFSWPAGVHTPVHTHCCQ